MIAPSDAGHDARFVEHDTVAVRFDEQRRRVTAVDQRAVHGLEFVVELRAVLDADRALLAAEPAETRPATDADIPPAGHARGLT
ncbi:hypothetical protein [Burkholderia ubonensis]|uniref:Uncharacterized protein n=1 Tax=Burkholderia ubonensis TaxID=101571 RepID=A0AAW3N961_9BURK|nr:hypothetical protein [Burkholderia ubonensis]KVT41287.1 hypothetical protein WK53_19680 [Burkholderia ubonensis]